MLYFLSFILLLDGVETGGSNTATVTSSVPVRLMGSSDACSGRVEIYKDSEWGTICDEGLDNIAANLVCYEVGCGPVISIQPSAFFGQGSGPVLTDILTCTGNESSVLDCNWGNHTDVCDHTKDVGVICDTTLRLQGGSGMCSGRVEVFHNRQYGTVCDTTWDINNALVVCKERGCGRPAALYYNAYFGMGTGPVWMDGISCNGKESSLEACVFSGWGVTTCTHAHDAGVTCSEFMFGNGPNACSGRVDVLYQNFGWGTVLDTNWNLLGGDVICKQMNCGSALSVTSGSAFGKGSGVGWTYNTTCTGTEITLKSCLSNYDKHTSHNNNAGVVCREVKLVNGQNMCHGTVQVRYIGDWGTICDTNWNTLNGIVLCRELGCGPLLSTYISAAYGNGTGNIVMDNVLCNGSESSLKDCSQATTVNSLCTHLHDAGVSCEEVRLAGGDSICSGRVEILINNQWGTVCANGWDLTDAAVVCRQLGCGTVVEANSGVYGSGVGPIWMNDVKCSGTESTVKNCWTNGWGANKCVHANDAGVVCREVQLVNMNNPCQGTLQVYHDGRWGTVCHNSWDIADGLVLCRELGCGGNAQPLSNAYFGAGSGPIWMDSLRCNGDETNLRKCQFAGWGNNQCIHAYDAGIICRDFKNVLKISVHSDSDPNNPSQMTKILDIVKGELKNSGNYTVTWRSQSNGQVFQEKKMFDP